MPGMNQIRATSRESLFEFFSRTNLLIVILVTLLCAFGLVALYSASLHADQTFFHKAIGKQVLWLIFGIILATIVFFIQKKLIYEWTYLLYAIGLILIIVPFFIDSETAGTHRWIDIGPFNLQPSEIMKILLVLAVAKYLSSTEIPTSDFRIMLLPLMATLIPMVIIFNQPDLGTAIIYVMILFPMLFWAGVRIFHIFVIIAPLISILTAFNFYTFFIWVIILFIVMYFSKEKLWIAITLSVINLSLGFVTPVLWNRLQPYQQDRIMTLFNVEADAQGAGYQLIQSQVAIGSGGLLGKGIGQGTQTHLKFLPEQQTDFIFSVIGEEYGFIGVTFVLLLFFLLILINVQSAYRMKDKYSSLVVIGLVSILFFHVVVNVSMTIGLLPVTGLPLPFISYGGSFLISCLIIIGLMMNFSIHRIKY